MSPSANADELSKLARSVPGEQFREDAVVWRTHFLARGDNLRGHFPAESTGEGVKNIGEFFSSLGEFKKAYDRTSAFGGYAPDVIKAETHEGFKNVLR